MSGGFDFSTCSEAGLWHYVAGHLEASGIGVVLVGGAVVAVYSHGAYQSGTGALEELRRLARGN